MSDKCMYCGAPDYKTEIARITASLRSDTAILLDGKPRTNLERTIRQLDELVAETVSEDRRKAEDDLNAKLVALATAALRYHESATSSLPHLLEAAKKYGEARSWAEHLRMKRA